jgi:hypothetical protein
MRVQSRKYVVDTNVAMTANLATRADSSSNVPDSCQKECVVAIIQITRKGGLVVDDDDGEIFAEYIGNLSLKGQPGVGDAFARWVHDNQWNNQKVDRVRVTKNGTSYDEFPDHDGLVHFDNSDRKFVAVANAHSAKPPVMQATDSKWWGWKDALAEVGITVHFLCPDYAKAKYEEKTGR